MFLVIARDLRSRSVAFDVLELELSDGFRKVLGHFLDHAQSTTLGQRTVGPIKGKVVGHVRHRQAQVRHWALAILVLQINSIGDNGKSRHPRCVETRGEDYHVDFDLVAVGIKESVTGDLG